MDRKATRKGGGLQCGGTATLGRGNCWVAATRDEGSLEWWRGVLMG